jgi:5-formyltetrahydrofolate cyclo-ligase
MSQAKERIRKAARTARRALGEQARAKASREVAHHVLGLWDLHDARTVLAYMAHVEEVDPAPVVEALWMRGMRIAVPRVEEPIGMALHLLTRQTHLEEGPFGITQPGEEAPRVDASEIDAVLVPGVAFDPSGVRVGYGGGFYDRLLPTLRGDVPLIGLAFDEQIVDVLPAHEHDVPMHVVVTPTRVMRRDVSAG